MCGIFFEVIRHGGHSVSQDSKIMQRIHNRGPDCVKKVTIDIGDEMKIAFCGAVLWMQGPNVTTQPVENDCCVLLYNGDIFDESWDHTISDTEVIMEKLGKHRDFQWTIEEMRQFKGPFSIILYDKATQNVLFTRDRIGRNTLLLSKTENSMVISSVLGRNYKCVEIPATNIQVLNLKTEDITLYNWDNDNQRAEVKALSDWISDLQNQQSLPDEKFNINLDYTLDLDDKDGVIKYIEENIQKEMYKISIMNYLLQNGTVKQTVLRLTELLEDSVKIRLKTQPQKCKDCLYREGSCSHCTAGILFSGGLDCTILAYLADRYIQEDQSIELLNVAFKKDVNGSYDVPDRLTGRQSFEELKKVCPNRKWVFKEINVSREEMEAFQMSHIADLVHPRQTILDESLGTALWFAARGVESNSISPCRVLILGSGADELFGGYTRHRNAFKRQGWAGLHKELMLDWKRISFRNLARDNRVICDHGRQPRMPYLDEDFTNFVLNLKPWLKCFPSELLGQGIGDKLMLRLVAFNLGLSEVATFPKRALQFGSRIANKKEKGSDLSKTFTDFKIND